MVPAKAEGLAARRSFADGGLQTRFVHREVLSGGYSGAVDE